jgi:serine/threonine-protein kinase
MGVVYEAQHEELGRRVAIKLLYPELARQPELLQRFFNEARAANAVQSAALVQVSECSVTPDGQAYLVMEYLPGQTLRSRLEKQKRLPEVDAARVAWQLALALVLVHDSNIVHRDLKPGNVMLVPDPADPAGERIKLLDFGVAKFVQKHNQNGGTRTGTRIGTPLYMAPEQCLGTSDLDGKADVYALGVMLFENMASVEKVREPFPTWL